MATYYFDADLGSNTTGDGSISNPWQWYDGKTSSIVAGDNVLFKRGTTQIVNSLYLFFRQGTISKSTYYGVYGSGDKRVKWFSNNTWGNIFNGSNTSYVTIEDFDFDCSNQSSGSIYFAGQGTGTITNIIIRRCSFYGAILGSGLSISKEEAATTATVSNCLIEYCDFYNNGAHGFIASGASNITVRKCRAWLNGSRNPYGGHGFSARTLRTSVTSGWTIISGTTYSRPLNANEYDVYYMQSTSTYARVYKNTSTPTTPALGEFGVSGGLIYINVGADPTGLTVNYAYENCSNILFESCESFLNIYTRFSLFHEGHGFALDDYTQNSIIRRCYSHDNQGLGISNNRGDGNLFESNVVVNNWQSGFTANPSDNLILRNNTIVNNNIGIGSHTGEVRFSTKYQRNHILTNNHIEAATVGNTYGVDADPLSTNIVCNYNNILNCTTSVRTATSNNTTNYASGFNTYYQPTSTSSLIGAGSYINIQDKTSSTFWNPPSIGAYEYIRPRTAR